jgi:hypothetical protein
MSILNAEFNPEDGKFHFILDEGRDFMAGDKVDVSLSPCEFYEFTNQAHGLVEYVVDTYFDGNIDKFFMSSHIEELVTEEMDSKEVAEATDRWLRKVYDDADFGG